jgi:hypothetical protein
MVPLNFHEESGGPCRLVEAYDGWRLWSLLGKLVPGIGFLGLKVVVIVSSSTCQSRFPEADLLCEND